MSHCGRIFRDHARRLSGPRFASRDPRDTETANGVPRRTPRPEIAWPAALLRRDGIHGGRQGAKGPRDRPGPALPDRSRHRAVLAAQHAPPRLVISGAGDFSPNKRSTKFAFAGRAVNPSERPARPGGGPERLVHLHWRVWLSKRDRRREAGGSCCNRADEGKRSAASADCARSEFSHVAEHFGGRPFLDHGRLLHGGLAAGGFDQRAADGLLVGREGRGGDRGHFVRDLVGPVQQTLGLDEFVDQAAGEGFLRAGSASRANERGKVLRRRGETVYFPGPTRGTERPRGPRSVQRVPGRGPGAADRSPA